MNSLNRLGAIFALALVALTCGDSQAVLVRFDTNVGDIDVRLYQGATPLSVQNFLNYVTDGDYNNSFIHRSVPGFVIQGGGYYVTPSDQVLTIPSDSPVQNEPGIFNLRGTLSYAKVAQQYDEFGEPIPGTGPNSATNGWFFNTVDNSTGDPNNLEAQNGGFTVFGRVIGDGLTVVDAIAGLRVANIGGAFTQLPVLDTAVPPNVFLDDLVYVESISVINLPDGDYNFDGVVDAVDYGVWRNSLGSSTQAEADGNGDGMVDEQDYTIWRQNFGVSSTGLAAISAPEPASVCLALLASFSLLRPTRRA